LPRYFNSLLFIKAIITVRKNSSVKSMYNTLFFEIFSDRYPIKNWKTITPRLEAKCTRPETTLANWVPTFKPIEKVNEKLPDIFIPNKKIKIILAIIFWTKNAKSRNTNERNMLTSKRSFSLI